LHGDDVIADLESRLEFRQVRVSGFDAARVVNRDEVAAGPLVTDRMYDTGTGGADRRTHRWAEIGALVGHDLVQDWMHAPGVEARRDGRSFDGLPPSALVDRAPVGIVVAVRFLTPEVVDSQRLRIAVRLYVFERLDSSIACEVAEHRHLLC